MDRNELIVGSRIATVDDESSTHKILKFILGKKGYKVSEYTDGEAALEDFKNDPPDLILLDVNMPGKDGFTICEELKTWKKTRDVPVIFLTAENKQDCILKGFKAGGVDYITKPYDKAELVARVETHLELKRSREEIQTLRGFIPICANCKKIRDDEGLWEAIEHYISSRSEAVFSHGICPDCSVELYPEIYGNKK